MIRARLRRWWRQMTRADARDAARVGAATARRDLAQARTDLSNARDLVAYIESLLGREN